MTDETKTKKPLNLVSLSERASSTKAPTKTYTVSTEMVDYFAALLESLKEPKEYEVSEGVLYRAVEICEAIIEGRVTQLAQVGVGENYILKNISGSTSNPFMMDSSLKWMSNGYSDDLAYAAGFYEAGDDLDD